MPYANDTERLEHARQYKQNQREKRQDYQRRYDARSPDQRDGSSPMPARSDAGFCQLCELPTRGETHIPNGDADWVCRDHAAMFWRGLIRVGSGLAELNRSLAEDTFTDEEAELHLTAIRESGTSPA